MKYLNMLFILLFTLFLFSCEEESDDIPTSFENVQTFLSDGWASYADGDYTAALGSFQSAVARQADNLEGHSGIGWAYFKLGNLDDASAKFSFVISLAGLKNDTGTMSDGYAGLCLAGIKRKIAFEAEGRLEAEMLAVKLNDIIYNGNKVLALNPDYAHKLEAEVVNAENIALEVAQTYFNILYFDNAIKMITVNDAGFITTLLSEVSNTTYQDTFRTLKLDEDKQIYLDWAQNNVITIDDMQSLDLDADPDEYALIEGTRIKFSPDFDLLTESLVVRDTVIAGAAVRIVYPTYHTAYSVEEAEDDEGFGVRVRPALDASGNPLGYLTVETVAAGESVTVSYRFIREVAVHFKKTTDFFKYLDVIAGKLYEMASS